MDIVSELQRVQNRLFPNHTGRIQMGMRTKVPGKILWPHDQ